MESLLSNRSHTRPGRVAVAERGEGACGAMWWRGRSSLAGDGGDAELGVEGCRGRPSPELEGGRRWATVRRCGEEAGAPSWPHAVIGRKAGGGGWRGDGEAV
jgi:hypothetical protein